MNVSEGSEENCYELQDYPTSILANTGFGLERTHYYLELARQLEVFLSPHPYRSEYYSELGKAYVGIPQKILSFTDEKIMTSQAANFLSVDLDIPAVAEYVVKFAMKKRVDIVNAIYEIRDPIISANKPYLLFLNELYIDLFAQK